MGAKSVGILPSPCGFVNYKSSNRIISKMWIGYSLCAWGGDFYSIARKAGIRQNTIKANRNKITALMITVSGSPMISAAQPAISEPMGMPPKKKNEIGRAHV